MQNHVKMIQIPGYDIVEEIGRAPFKLMVRAIRTEDSVAVILKIALTSDPESSVYKEMEHEFSVSHVRLFDNILNYTGKIRLENYLVLELSDFTGKNLSQYIEQEIPLRAALSIASSLVQIVSELHYNGILHRDIRPENFLIDLDTLDIRLTDLKFSCQLGKEDCISEVVNNNLISFEYISPEQSGRMSHKEDYRSDYYTLGIVLYRLFAGKLPFENADHNELMHAHMAKQAIAPSQVNDKIPSAVSDLILKLIEKKPEGRYQTTKGILHDLNQCKSQLMVYGEIVPFQVGQYDLRGFFEISKQLYGREKEIDFIFSAFENAKYKNEMVLVHGTSGIGKSSLVQQVKDRLGEKEALFVTGKFEQYVQNIPFEAVVKAFEELICKISRGDSSRVAVWKRAILEAVGDYGQVIIEVIPQLELITGKQPEVQALNPVESQVRFVNVFSSFINVFTKKDHPLVIFLDDLQWADASSLRFLSRVMEAVEGRYLFIIGSYRDNELSEDHPLVHTLEEMRKGGKNFHQIGLSSLKVSEISALVADTFSCPPYAARPLAEIIFTKTLGNPFFICESLKTLYRENLICFDDRVNNWVWDITAILGYSDSKTSLELLTHRMNQLPETVRHTLSYASCIGQQFNLELLAALSDKTPQETAEEIKELIGANLINISSERTADPDRFLSRVIYGFTHDQVQQAAYALLTGHVKRELHLSIGYFMLERLSARETDSQIFEIVNHLNHGAGTVEADKERYRLAALNLKAGRKAKISVAYPVALEYFKTGIKFLSEQDWDYQYQLVHDLHTECAESTYLTGDLEGMEALTAIILQNSISIQDRVNTYQIQIQSLIFHDKGDQAIKLSLNVLRELGVSFPQPVGNVHILAAYLKTRWNMRGMKIEDLEQLPLMTDISALAVMRIMQSITAIVFVRIPLLYPLMVLKMVSLSIKYGNAPESALTYITYAAIDNAIRGQNQACYQYGKMALKLLEKVESLAVRERSVLIFNIINRPAGEHISHSLEPLKRSYKVGIELGDIEYCIYSSSAYCFFLLLSGKNLSWIKEEMIHYNHLPKSFSEHHNSNQNEALIQIVSNLLGENEKPVELNGVYFNEGENFSGITALNEQSRVFTCFTYKMILCYMTGQYEPGLQNAKLALLYMDNVKGMLFQPLFYFYYSLLNFTLFCNDKSQKHYLKTAVTYKEKSKKWADQVPVNYLHRQYLLEAEYFRCTDKNDKATLFYDKAIKQAQDNSYCQDEALANELYGNYWINKGQHRLGDIYINSAIEAYQKWGCLLKCDQLKAKYTDQTDLSGEFLKSGSQLPKSKNANIPSIDLSTLMKASMAISSEVVFARLMDKLMKFAIENAGAQSGFFILDWGGKLFIEARQTVEEQQSDVRKIPLEESHLVPRSIIEYVFQTQSDVVLNDAKADEQFKDDPVIMESEIKSALCIPALNQGKVVGVLYLENNLTRGVFTQERTELLKLLSGQIAVSIENAILYEKLEQKVAVRTAEIQVQKEEIERQKLLVEEKTRFKEQFFANMSHEIRTPMTAIIGMSELIFDTQLSAKQLEYAKGIRYSSENLLAIINDILDYSKIEAGKFSFVNKPFDIRDRMNRLGYVLKVIAEEKGIALHINVHEEISAQLIGDPLRLHQILLNLVSNAIKFTEHGAVWIDVSSLSINEESEELLFKIRDTGIGIAEDKLQYIFETFTRIDEDLNSKQTGTGLGLFIAKRLVEEQGGKMTVTSQLKVGTEFCFNLSFEPCGIGSSAEDADSAIYLSDVKILLVEDNLFNQVVAEETLKKIISNVEVTIADNGQVALEKLENQTFDIVLMDVKMPVMDGYKATRAIRSGSKQSDIPILAFTSNANPAESQKCKEAGMNDYITKPIEAKKLKSKIKKLLDIQKEKFAQLNPAR